MQNNITKEQSLLRKSCEILISKFTFEMTKPFKNFDVIEAFQPHSKIYDHENNKAINPYVIIVFDLEKFYSMLKQISEKNDGKITVDCNVFTQLCYIHHIMRTEPEKAMNNGKQASFLVCNGMNGQFAMYQQFFSQIHYVSVKSLEFRNSLFKTRCQQKGQFVINFGNDQYFGLCHEGAVIHSFKEWSNILYTGIVKFIQDHLLIWEKVSLQKELFENMSLIEQKDCVESKVLSELLKQKDIFAIDKFVIINIVEEVAKIIQAQEKEIV